jgi:homoserine kinase
VRAAFGGAMGGWQILPLPVAREGATVHQVT